MKGIVYAFVNRVTNEMYIGSTSTSLRERHHYRKNEYNQWCLKKTDNKLFRNIEQYGWNCFSYKVLEQVEVSTKQELFTRECFYITKHNSIAEGLNMRNENQNTIDRKAYYKKNKHKICQANLAVYNKSKDAKKKQMREYYHKNKNSCMCYVCSKNFCSNSSLKQHRRSNKHRKVCNIPKTGKIFNIKFPTYII